MNSQKTIQLLNILKETASLKEACTDRLAEKLLQKNYNNLFCLLLKEGIEFSLDNDSSVIISTADKTYSCHTDIIRNILREEYRTVMERNKQFPPKPEATSGSITPAGSTASPRIIPIRPFDQVQEAGSGLITPVSDDVNEPAAYVDNSFKEKTSMVADDALPVKKHRANVFSKLIKPDVPSAAEVNKSSHIGFVPKKLLATATPEPIDIGAEPATELPLYIPEEPVLNLNKHGSTYRHICLIYLSKKLGSEVFGPYKVVFYPTSIPSSNGKRFAEALITVESIQHDARVVKVCDAGIPEIIIKIDGKELKICGMWDQGQFAPYISLLGKTASIFNIEIEEESHIPAEADNCFLNQFRISKKGQPPMFIIPTQETNNGSETIPIIGYVDYNGNKYPLISGADNRIRYSLGKRERSFYGSWDGISFCVKEDKANSIHFEF